MQIKTAHPLAITYNDQSPLENHHHAAAVRLLLQPEHCYLPVSLHVLLCVSLHTKHSSCHHGCILYLLSENSSLSLKHKKLPWSGVSTVARD